MKLALMFAVPMLAFAPVALADEAIQTHAGQTPAPAQAETTVASTQNDPRQANGEWARRVLAGQSTEDPIADDKSADAKGCHRNPDRQPHGEVWAGIGTGGYRNVGGVVTEPVGDCGQATIAIDHTEFDGLNRGRRR